MSHFTLLDGGMGRELKRAGAPFKNPLWSAQALIDDPQTVAQAHQRFIDAGAQIITINSYACVPFHLGDELYHQRGAELVSLAAQLARQTADAAPAPVQVAGSLPPPLGSYRPDLFEATAAANVYQMLLAQQTPYCDLWIAETIASLEEISTISKVVRQSDKPCYYAFTLADDMSDGPVLRSGQSVASAVALACAAGAAGVMFNCSVPEVMNEAVVQAASQIRRDNASASIGVYANNFAPISKTPQANATFQAVREMRPEDYVQYAQQWHTSGASIIGGCCGIGPEHIDALRQWQQTITCDGQ